ncbi:hypothetical protein SynBIOSE41_03983 [Synechococcus sp. BIOS-E4-1]|nr:hypothetical protein SynBIOSE41_03983 [Synechococcus sp. BIOS-E4-1]
MTAEVQAEQQGGQGEQQGHSVESGQSSAEEWFEQQLLEGERLQARLTTASEGIRHAQQQQSCCCDTGALAEVGDSSLLLLAN